MATKTKQRKTRTMYMHTLDGHPASYRGAYQIHFVGRASVRLFASLKEIRANEAATVAYRTKRGFGMDNYKLGYVRVEVPLHAR